MRHRGARTCHGNPPVLLSLLSIPTCVAGDSQQHFLSPMLTLVTSRTSIYGLGSEVSPLLPSLPGLSMVLPTQHKPQLHVYGTDLATVIWATQTLGPQGESGQPLGQVCLLACFCSLQPEYCVGLEILPGLPQEPASGVLGTGSNPNLEAKR